MPCNAIARAAAAITEENLLALLTDDLIQPALQHFLSTTYPALPLQAHPITRSTGVSFQLGACTLMVRNGRIQATGSTDRYPTPTDRAFVTTLTTQVETFLRDLAGAVLQQQVSEALTARYQIIDQQQAPHTSLVIRLKM